MNLDTKNFLTVDPNIFLIDLRGESFYTSLISKTLRNDPNAWSYIQKYIIDILINSSELDPETMKLCDSSLNIIDVTLDLRFYVNQ